MANRIYVVAGVNMTIASSNPLTLAFVHPGTTASLAIKRVQVSQYGASLASQQCGIQLSTQVTAFPTLTAATPNKTSLSDPASVIVSGTAGAAGTAGVNASAENAGAKSVIIADTFNNLNGWLWVPTPDEELILSASSASGFGVVLLSTAATLTGWNVSVTYKEY